MSAEVVPNFKPQVDCPCDKSCGRVGTPLRNGHVRGCDCRRCLGRRNRRKGKDAERSMRRMAGVQVASNAHAALGEEFWDSFFRDECKSGKQVEPIATRFLAAESQSEGSRAVGDARPFRMLARPERMPGGLVLVRGEVWHAVVQPALDEFFGTASHPVVGEGKGTG